MHAFSKAGGLDEATCGKVDGHVGKGLSVLSSIKSRPEDTASLQRGKLDWVTGCLAGLWPQNQSILPHENVENPLVFEDLQMEDREKPTHPWRF